MSRISQLFERLRGQKRPALIAYLTAGDPSMERTPSLIAALERGGADLIELGVPFSDPVADGPVIQAADLLIWAPGPALQAPEQSELRTFAFEKTFALGFTARTGSSWSLIPSRVCRNAIRS